MFSIWFWKKYSGRPLHMFGGLGIASGFIGVVLGSYSAYLRMFRNVDLSDTFLPVVSVFMVMIGIQLFVSGILERHLRKRHITRVLNASPTQSRKS